ncbi:YebG family protein [Thiocapsa sp.]|uniref:YebG family protein n=1 Tax=Thiocapsa sp. TaxID=2024551 RepID=UPI0025CFF915|nr:YebG family protein [Thiocapsa sp.]
MIEIEYVVRDQKGAERLRTTDKKAADAYDKALESAERLAELLRHDKVLPDLPESDLEDLTIYLARNAKTVERILKGKSAEIETVETEKGDIVKGAEQPEATSKVAPLRAAS